MWKRTVLLASLSWMTCPWHSHSYGKRLFLSSLQDWFSGMSFLLKNNQLFSQPFQPRHLWSWPAALPSQGNPSESPYHVEMNVANPMPSTMPKIAILWGVGFQPSPAMVGMVGWWHWVSHMILFHLSLMGFHVMSRNDFLRGGCSPVLVSIPTPSLPHSTSGTKKYDPTNCHTLKRRPSKV